MSRSGLHRVAQESTPQSVQVPPTIQGLLVWAVGEFGGVAIILAGFAYGLHIVYGDLKATNERVLTLVEHQTKAMADTAAGLESIRIEFREAYTRAKAER